MEASVSVPTETTVKFAATDTAEPELDPPTKRYHHHMDLILVRL